MSAVVQLDQHVRSREVRRRRSLVQGDPAAPLLFEVALDPLVRQFEDRCRQEGWGVHGGQVFCPIILFADNFWLLDSDCCRLQDMYRCWLDLLRRAGWEVQTEECTWTTSADEDIPWHEGIRDEEGREVKRSSKAEGFKVLGTMYTLDNNDERELQHRVARAWKAWFRWRSILCCRHTAPAKRLRLAERVLRPAVLWCAGSWNLRSQQLQRSRITGYLPSARRGSQTVARGGS